MPDTPLPSRPTPASLPDLLLDVVCMVDAHGRFVHLSAACESVFGYRPDELIGHPMIELVLPEDRDRTLQAARRVMDGQPHLHFENRYRRKDGRVVHLMWSARWSEADQLRVAVARDITERKRAEQLQAATYAISEAAHGAEDLGALCRVIHATLDALLPGRQLTVALLDEPGGRLDFPYCGTDGSDSPREDEALTAFCRDVMAAGHPLPSADRPGWLGVPLLAHPGVIGVMVLGHDDPAQTDSEADQALLQYISTQVATALERKRLYERLHHLSFHDTLTGLPNRALLRDRLRLALARARRQERFLSVLYLDLDRFKEVNDTWGHLVGDGLLKAFAERLLAQVRASDTVARVGGDEFVVLLESVRGLDGHRQVAEKIRLAFEAPFVVEGITLTARPSIGQADFPDQGQDEGQLLSAADSAMYALKGRP